MASPATTDTTSGRKNGIVTVGPASAANTPLRETSSRNVGPRPAEGPPERRTARASSAGTAASTTMSARIRSRRNSVPSSASNIETLAGECHERVFERRSQRGHAPDPDTGEHQFATARLGRAPVEPAHDDRPIHLQLGQPEPLEYPGGQHGIVGLDPQTRRAHALQLGEGPLCEELAEGHDRDVGTNLLDLRQQMAGEK